MQRKYEIIVIGASRGGLQALETLLGSLAKDFPLPIAVVQHRLANGGNGLCELLQRRCALTVVSVEDKQPLVSGCVYIAPPDYHLLIDHGLISLSTDEPLLFSRPSINVLFESVADAYADRAIGIIMTGANSDGAQGLAQLKRRGALVIVQDPDTAESRTMPDAALAALKNTRTENSSQPLSIAIRNTKETNADYVLPVKKIGPLLEALCCVDQRVLS